MHTEPPIAEFAEEAAFLWLQRDHAVDAPHYSLMQMADLDERLAAQIDALRLAGDPAWNWCEDAAAQDSAETAFVVASLVDAESPARVERVVQLARTSPDAARGVASALAWESWARTSTVIKAMTDPEDAASAILRIKAFALQRRDPGTLLDGWLRASSSAVRTQAARAAGEIGRVDLAGPVAECLHDTPPSNQFDVARAALLLGERTSSLRVLKALVLGLGRQRLPALQTCVQALPPSESHDLLRQLDGLPDALRLRIQGSGCSGNVRYVPWLIDQISNPAVARIAAEAFVLITGADFNLEQMESMPPPDFEDGPSDDPADESVEVPQDISLPWPDVDRVKTWWLEHRSRIASSDTLFLGQPASPAWYRRVLESGFQRQRVYAALRLCLIEPGLPLFPTSAPMWRQQDLMAKS